MTKAVLTAAAVVLVVAAVAGAVRLLPWVASPSVPLAIVAVFARVLFAAALEVALIVAAPIGIGLEACRLSLDGSLRTFQTLGVGPARPSLHAALVAFVLALASAGVSFFWSQQAQSPGALSNQLVQAGRAVCSSQGAASVPIVGLTWLCVGQQPRLVGIAGPQREPSVAWSASDGRFESDLSSATLVDLRATLREPRIDLQVQRATVSGFGPWMPGGAGGGVSRSLAFGLVAVLASLSTCWALMRWTTTSRAVALIVGCAGPSGFLLCADPLLSPGGAAGMLAVASVAIACPFLARWSLLGVGLLDAAHGGT